MKKKWVSSLLLGSLFLQVVTPMVSFAQETMETTATSATIKKEDNPTKSSTNTSASKDAKEQPTAQPEASNSIDTNHPLNLSPVPTGKPSDTEKKNLDNQEATKPSIQAAAPVADDNLGPELFTNSKFIDWGSGINPTTIPGWSVLSGGYSMNVSAIEWPPEEITHERFRIMTLLRGEAMIYQDVSVTPGSTLSFGNFYTNFIQVSKNFIVYAGPISNNLEDFSVVDAFTPPAGNNVWKRVNFVVPQGMNKMRIIIKGKKEDGIPPKFTGFSLKQDLNPPVNTAPPVINASDRRLALNATFDPLEGVTATDADDGPITLTEANVVHNDVDTSKEGTYSVIYSVTDSGGLTTRKTITVTVGDANTPPVIHVPNTTVSIPQGGSFDPAPSNWNITATDAEDGDLTKNIVVKSNNVDTSKPGQYKVTYSVTDSGSLNTTADMTVVVSPTPNTPPVIHIPNVPVSVLQGDSFDPAPSKWNITATDVEDGDLTSKIKVKNNTVDTTKPGFYEVTYSVTDNDNIEITADMPVTVMPSATGVVNLTVDRDRFDIEEGQSVDITGEVWSPMDVTLIANLTEKGSSKTLDQDIFIGSLANQHNQYSLSVPEDNLSVGTHTFVVSGVGNGTQVKKEVIVNVKDAQIGEKPVIQAENKTIVQNSDFDPLADVSATDKEDGTVPVTVHENTVDTSNPGTYKVVYWATDSDKNTTEKTITVTVEPSELSFNVPDALNYDKQALSGNKEYAKRTDKNWQITIDNSKKVKWQVKAKAGEIVGETSHAKYKDATVYVDDLGNESSLAATVLIAQGDEQKVDPIINWQEDKGVLFAVDPTSMKAENYKGTINWTLEQAP